MKRRPLRRAQYSQMLIFLASMGGPVLGGPTVASAQEVKVDGIVYDAGRAIPLEHAVVGFPELEKWDLTDESGMFTLEGVTTGTFRFIVLRRGYYMADQDLTVTEPLEIAVEMTEEEEGARLDVGSVIGVVRDQESGRPVDQVEVRAEPTGQEVRTNRQGRFDISGISAGALQLTLVRIGYEPRVDTIAAFPGATFDLSITMSQQPIQLEPLIVTVRPRFLEAAGFYRRARLGGGHRMDRDAIERRAPVDLTQLLQTVPGVRLGRGEFGETVLLSSRGGGGCELTVWVDGMRMMGIDINHFLPHHVEAVEVYVGVNVPARYYDDCGVLLIWTRR